MRKKIQKTTPKMLCIYRRKYGKGYAYLDKNGKKITDVSIQKRIAKLVIPPNWKEVMICKFEDGHIQATGKDDDGRTQYIYHSDWTKQREKEKFDKLPGFGKRLPHMRKACHRYLLKEKWSKRKVLALLVLILDECGVRIGNKRYAQQHETYGLTTLRRKHLSVDGDTLRFEYKGKSDQDQKVDIDDEELAQSIKEISDEPGHEIFRYRDRKGKYKNINSSDVNEFIKLKMGKKFSAKFFRTWTATRMAVELYPQVMKQNDTKKKKANILIHEVAQKLGNTPSVCRDYYVHPRVLQACESETVPENPKKQTQKKYKTLEKEEQIVLDIIGR